ncbi:MAG: peptidylprolyl isomerase [Clostridiaceae bacterium]
MNCTKKIDKKMNMSSGKRKSKVYIAGGLIILFTMLLIPAAKSLIAEYRNANAIVARVNDEPVSRKELKQWMIFSRAGVYNYFMNKYGAQDSNEFWESSYSGEVPVDMARKNSLDDIVKIKVQQILARQEGLLQDISYEAFLREFDEENKSRKEAIKNNKVVYGPFQYDIKEYFTYYFNNLTIKLKEKLSENEISFSDKELNNYYQSVKDKMYKKSDYVKVQMIYTSLNGENTEKMQERKALMEQISTELEKGKRIEEIVEINGKIITCKELIFDDKTNTKLLLKIRDEAYKLPVGQLSAIIEEENGDLYLLQCTERKSLGYIPFEECKENVKTKYIDIKYNELIDKYVKEAEIQINKNDYNSTTMKK